MKFEVEIVWRAFERLGGESGSGATKKSAWREPDQTKEGEMGSRSVSLILWTLVCVNSLTLVVGGLTTWLGYAIPAR